MEASGVTRLPVQRRCVFPSCTGEAIVYLAIHRRSDVLLGPVGEAFCHDHWIQSTALAVKQLLTDPNCFGIGIMKP